MDTSFAQSAPVLYRAPWLIPVGSAVIKDGGLAVQNGQLIALGPFQEVTEKIQAQQIVHSSSVLMPGLINTHIHLELALFGPLPQDDPSSTMCDWIRQLLQKRMTSSGSEEQILEAAIDCAKQQYAQGVVALLDIANKPLPPFPAKCPDIYPLLELLGASEQGAEIALTALNSMDSQQRATGHAPYSTAPKLLQRIKARCRKNHTLFSLHVAENSDEAQLLLHGQGCFETFLKERGIWDDTFPLEEGCYRSVVDYLFQTGLLDAQTVCVHCVHVDEDDVELIQKSGSSICVCPSSNRFLGVGEAPIELFLKKGLLPAIGTDSVTSNPPLRMWEEMKCIRKSFPKVAAETIVAMATLGGARAMGIEAKYGTLEVGKSAPFIGVSDQKIASAQTEKEVLESLVTLGDPEEIQHYNTQ